MISKGRNTWVSKRISGESYRSTEDWESEYVPQGFREFSSAVPQFEVVDAH